MKYTMGIDVGTEGTKVLVVDERGSIVKRAVSSYQFDVPKTGWAEQDPEVWWQAVISCIQSVWQQGIQPEDVVAVGVSGQMHSSVLLDAAGEVIRKSILWNDMRPKQVCDEVLEHIGPARYQGETCNSLLPGFTLGKLLWLKKYELESYQRIAKVLMPKDFINYKLTGQYSADVTDASGTGLFDVRLRQWHRPFMKELDLDESWFPQTYESAEVVGTVSSEASRITGLAEGKIVVAGAADNAASAVGMGIVTTERGLVSVGTSGVVLTCLEKAPSSDEAASQNPTLHVFCHAIPDMWYGMGVTLTAGASLRWFRDALGQGLSYDELMERASQAPPGADGLVYLPFLAGERTPHNSERLRGGFFGMALQHQFGNFVRAVIEGVSYSLRDCLELIRETSANAGELLITGGVIKSNVWLTTLANILELPLYSSGYSEGASYGAALLAGLAAGFWNDLVQVVSANSNLRKTEPNISEQVYRDGYKKYRHFSVMQMRGC